MKWHLSDYSQVLQVTPFPADSIWGCLYLSHGTVNLIRLQGWEWLHQEESHSNAMEMFLGKYPWCLEKENAQRQSSPAQLQEEGNDNQGNELHVSNQEEKSLSDLCSGWGGPAVGPLASPLASHRS